MVAEEDPALLRETLSRFDYSALLANERFLLGVGETDDHFFRDLQVAAVSEIQEVNMVIFSPLHAMNEGYYDQMRNELVRQYLCGSTNDGSEFANCDHHPGKYL